MPNFKKVEYEDGDFDFIGEPPLKNYHLLNLLHDGMQSLLDGKPAWHPDTKIGEETISDINLRAIATYIPKIASLFNPPLQYLRFTKRSLYEFFVCTEPFEHEGVQVGGLSHLRSLMGHDIGREQEVVNDGKIKHTTGDIVADVTASILLSFEGGGMELLEYPLSFCINVLKQASELSKSEAEKKENKMLYNAIRRQEETQEYTKLVSIPSQTIDKQEIPEHIRRMMPDV